MPHRPLEMLLGHAKLGTTALYTHVATETIREIVRPLDHITRKLGRCRPPEAPRASRAALTLCLP